MSIDPTIVSYCQLKFSDANSSGIRLSDLSSRFSNNFPNCYASFNNFILENINTSEAILIFRAETHSTSLKITFFHSDLSNFEILFNTDYSHLSVIAVINRSHWSSSDPLNFLKEFVPAVKKELKIKVKSPEVKPEIKLEAMRLDEEIGEFVLGKSQENVPELKKSPRKQKSAVILNPTSKKKAVIDEEVEKPKTFSTQPEKRMVKKVRMIRSEQTFMDEKGYFVKKIVEEPEEYEVEEVVLQPGTQSKKPKTAAKNGSILSFLAKK